MWVDFPSRGLQPVCSLGETQVDFPTRNSLSSSWRDVGWFPIQGTSAHGALLECLEFPSRPRMILWSAWDHCLFCFMDYCLLYDRFVCHCSIITQIYDHNYYKSKLLFILPSLVRLWLTWSENSHHRGWTNNQMIVRSTPTQDTIEVPLSKASVKSPMFPKRVTVWLRAVPSVVLV